MARETEVWHTSDVQSMARETWRLHGRWEGLTVPSHFTSTSEIVADFQPVESTMNSDTAATIIQAYVRRYLAKRIYFQKLLEKFKKDEAVRHEKEQQQVSEGETLVIRYRLQMEIAELETITLNKQRRENAMAIRIQRAWRDYSRTNLASVPSIQHTTDLLQYSTRSTSAVAMNGSHVPTSMSTTGNVVQDNGTLVSRVDLSGDYHNSGMANGVMPRRPAWVPGSNNYQLMSRLPLTKNFISSQSKYRLCFTSDLSESSGEEQELTSDLSATSHSNELVENGHSSRSEEDWSGMDARNDDLFMSMERRLKELVSTTDDFIFSGEFDDGSFQSNSERDSLLDSATLEIEDVSSRRSICPSHGSVANDTSYQQHTHGHHDHSNSALYAMTVQELKVFLKQIKLKMKAISKDLTADLIMKDELVVENKLLHQNIAHLARNTQSLYHKSVPTYS